MKRTRMSLAELSSVNERLPGAQLDVTVMLATCRRPDSLADTLESLAASHAPGITREVLIVDNAPGDTVRSIVAAFSTRLSAVYVPEPRGGKNQALNTGLSRSRGELLVFTDDDVGVAPDWLEELWRGVARHPSASLFGGRILPRFPPGHEQRVAQLDTDHWFIRSAYVQADWGEIEQPIDASRIWGPNMAVRRRVFESGLRFDPALGPCGADYVMGGETEFLLRAQRAGHAGVYLPRALVHHCIRAEQLSAAWLRGRAFRMGRGHALRGEAFAGPRVGGVPRYLLRQYLEKGLQSLSSWPLGERRRLAARLELELVRGQIHEYWSRRGATRAATRRGRAC